MVVLGLPAASIRLNSPDELARRELGAGELEMPGGGNGAASGWGKME